MQTPVRLPPGRAIAGDEARLNRVDARLEDYRDRRGRVFRRQCRRHAVSRDNVDFAGDEVGGQFR